MRKMDDEDTSDARRRRFVNLHQKYQTILKKSLVSDVPSLSSLLYAHIAIV